MKPERDPVYLGIQMFVEWHTFIDSLNIPRYKLEDINGQNGKIEFEKVMNMLSKIFPNMKTTDTQACKTVANKSAHRKTFDWASLFKIDLDYGTNYADRAWHLAKKYGYKYDFDYDKRFELAKAIKTKVTC